MMVSLALSARAFLTCSWTVPASMASPLDRRSSRVFSRPNATVSPPRCRPFSTACRRPANERCPRPAAKWRDRGGDWQRPRGRSQEAGYSAADGRREMGPALRSANRPADVRCHAPSRRRGVTQQMSAKSHEPTFSRVCDALQPQNFMHCTFTLRGPSARHDPNT